MPPDPPSQLSHLRRSHTNTILGGRQGKWALWQFCPTTEESLKNALVVHANYRVIYIKG
jgi:hypothetical protein